MSLHFKTTGMPYVSLTARGAVGGPDISTPLGRVMARPYRNSQAGGDNFASAQANKPPPISGTFGALPPCKRTALRQFLFYGSKIGAHTPLNPSPPLQRAFATLADESVPLPEFPAELETLIPPGAETRFYFGEGNRLIRLTVRRHENGSWRFGHTAIDKAWVDEAYTNDVEAWKNKPDFGYGTRYTPNESYRLEHDWGRTPVEELRCALRYIRHALIRACVAELFPETFATWKRAIPEYFYDAEVMELILHVEKTNYDLARGFVSVAERTLTPDQEKTLAAIRHLVENHLVYWSSNAQASGVKTGIYPEGSVTVTGINLVGIPLEGGLFAAMKKAGLEYNSENMKWVAKGDNAPLVRQAE